MVTGFLSRWWAFLVCAAIAVLNVVCFVAYGQRWWNLAAAGGGVLFAWACARERWP